MRFAVLILVFQLPGRGAQLEGPDGELPEIGTGNRTGTILE